LNYRAMLGKKERPKREKKTMEKKKPGGKKNSATRKTRG